MKIDYIRCADLMGREGINSLENNSIQLIITSPPYNTTRCHLDDRGYDIYQDDKTVDDYITWTINIFKTFDKILDKNGVILYNLSTGTENHEQMWLLLAEIIKETPFTISDVLVWKKKTAMPNPMSKNKTTRICEYIFVISRKSEYKTFNMNKRAKSYRKTGQPNYENIYNFIEAKNNDGACNLNKATFSTELVCKLIDMYSLNENDIILDPFMGTGTTACGAIMKNRHYIGFEISEAQVNYSLNRINNLKSSNGRSD